MGLIDLHIHSTASDGSDAPREVVEKAARLGLKAIALTDHDTLDGLTEAEQAAKAAGIKFIPGCELSTSNELGSFHILGLWAPQDNQDLNNFINMVREKRVKRNEAMVAKLQNLGFDISMAEILAQTNGAGGRPHMAELLLQKGYVKDRAEAFAKYIGKDGLAYVPKNSPDPAQTVELLDRAGATVILAHPLLNPVPVDVLENFIKKLAEHGLSGLEALHSSHTPKQREYLRKLAAANNLVISGGSDYHGKPKPAIQIGSGCGDLQVPEEILDNLIALRKARGLPC